MYRTTYQEFDDDGNLFLPRGKDSTYKIYQDQPEGHRYEKGIYPQTPLSLTWLRVWLRSYTMFVDLRVLRDSFSKIRVEVPDVFGEGTW